MANSSIFSVASAGAAGNGSTDDTAAIQNALNSEADVYFPPGKYLLTAPLAIQPGGMVRGAGRGATTLVLQANSGRAVFEMTGRDFITVADMSLDASNAPACILAHSCQHFSARHLNLKNSAATALGLDQAGGGASHWSEVIDCYFENVGDHAVYISVSDNCNVRGCRGVNIGGGAAHGRQGGSGICLADGNYCSLVDNNFIGAGNTTGFGGLRVAGGRHNIITGNRIRRFSRGVMLIGEADFNVVSSNVLQDILSQGIFIGTSSTTQHTSASWNTVQGNTILNGGVGFAGISLDLMPNSTSIVGNVIEGNVIADNRPAGMAQAIADNSGSPGENVFANNRTNISIGV